MTLISRNLGNNFTFGEIEDFIEEIKQSCNSHSVNFDKNLIQFRTEVRLEYSIDYESGDQNISGVVMDHYIEYYI